MQSSDTSPPPIPPPPPPAKPLCNSWRGRESMVRGPTTAATQELSVAVVGRGRAGARRRVVYWRSGRLGKIFLEVVPLQCDGLPLCPDRRPTALPPPAVIGSRGQRRGNAIASVLSSNSRREGNSGVLRRGGSRGACNL